MSVISVNNFNDAGQALVKLVHERSREHVFKIWWNLVADTPVCSGKAAASWRASAGTPKTADRLPTIAFSKTKGCERVYDDPRNGISSPKALLGSYTRNYTNWFITNSTDYISALNDGSSSKAPTGFIDIAIKKGLA